MEIKLHKNGEEARPVVEVSGRLDLRVAQELQQQLSDALNESGGRLVVDLVKVEFIDSSVLGVLVGLFRNAQELDGEFLIVEPEGPAKQIFTLTKTDQYFSMYPSLDKAIAAVPD